MRFRNITRPYRIIIAALFFACFFAGQAISNVPEPNEKYRAKLLSNLISKQMTTHHFSHKPINDDLSKQAFDLYLKQLDPRKRFFLKQDIESLQAYKTLIDDEMNNGQIRFPLVAEELLNQRVKLVEEFLKEIIDNGFNFKIKESIESDIEKLDYCSTEKELKDRWRKSLKYQIIVRYLNMLEDEEGKQKLKKETKDGQTEEEPPKTPEQIREAAKEEILKSNLNLLHRLTQRKVKGEFDRFFSVFARAFDPHSSFMPPDDKEDFDIRMSGSLEGIGAVLQEEDGYIKVLRIIPGGAAYRQKQLEAEDVILMVAQDGEEPVDITNMPIREAVGHIRGPKGTKVILTVKKTDGKVTLISIVRDVVQLEETFVKTVTVEGNDGNLIGYMKIPSFYRDFQGTQHGGNGRNVTDDVKKDLDMLKKKNIKGLIIDLRNNGGGALIDAVKVTGLFIRQGPIVQTKATDDKIDTLYDYDPGIEYEGPLLVLINRFTASASEIMAGALQDYGRALIVGSDHTYGKGTVQTLVNLDNTMPFFNVNFAKYKPLGHLKLTTQQFYRINGESTQNKGVVPDVILPDRFQHLETGERYMDYALPWDKIEPLKYHNWNMFKENLVQLRSSSQGRVSKSEEFKEIINESEEAKRRQDKSLISLHIDDIRAEREKGKEKLEARTANGEMPYDGHGENTSSNGGTREEMLNNLQEEIKKDPYVNEALKLIYQMIS